MIETDRLRIGPLAEAEREELVAIWLDPANERVRPGNTPQQVRRWVQDAWGVWERETGELIGDCTLFYSDDHAAWELAYGLRRDRWGRGYATEAVTACVRHGFEDLGLDRIVADVEASNAASIRVLEKCGFVRAGGSDIQAVYAITR